MMKTMNNNNKYLIIIIKGVCESGTYCPLGSTIPTSCPDNTFSTFGSAACASCDGPNNNNRCKTSRNCCI